MANSVLPIAAFRDEIVASVRKNPVTIITAETGAGKSTQVPQFLLEEGFSAIVSQPRRVAARMVATRVAEEHGTPLGEIVGFRTAYEHEDSDATRCLFVTDGLALVRELMGRGPQILVIDEVHEWNLNIEVIVAWVKLQIKRAAKFKVVLMSATLEADRLSDYFGGVPVISVPGRLFPVEERAPEGKGPHEDAARLLRNGHNVLMFVPGKAEIENTIRYMENMGLNAELLPLHGQLSAEEQSKCFRTDYGRPKCVVATNVAQTSVTIGDIDAVVDNGLERRMELRDGVEGLYLGPISLADREQRKGRAGRTKPGVYIDWCPIDEAERLEFPEAEILRVRLHQTVLRLAATGIDMEELEFFHQPDLIEIRDAKRVLVALGCMDAEGRVTKIGHRIAKLPVSVKYARMIVEAMERGVVDDVVTIAALLEQGGIAARVCTSHQGYRRCECWVKLTDGETSSDAIALLRAYHASKNMKPREAQAAGINPKALRQVKEKRGHLVVALREFVQEFTSSGVREDIIKSICAGMVDNLYEVYYGMLRRGDDQRRLANESVVESRKWIVGEPWDLEIPVEGGTRVLNLLKSASEVDPSWLREIAPHLIETRRGTNPYYNKDLDEVVSTTQTWFNGQLIESCEVLDPTHPEATRLRRDGRNLKQWSEWDRPEVDLPNLADDNSVIPEIASHVYGQDVGDGTPLVAYAVVAYDDDRYLSSQPLFKVTWTRDADEASRLHQRSKLALPGARRELRMDEERRRKDALRELALPVERRAYRFYESNLYELSEELRRKLRTRIPDTSSREEMDEWITEMETTIASAQAFLEKSAAEHTELTNRVQVLRTKASSLLDDHGDQLSEDLERELIAIEDYRGASLGDDVDLLRGWVTWAEGRITEVEKLASQESVGADALAMLRGHFNSSR